MPAPTSKDQFIELVRKSGVLDEKRLDAYVQKLAEAGESPDTFAKLATVMVRDGLLTNYQSEQLLHGRWRRFTIGKYKVLERLGSGGMGSVFLCEHKFMRRLVALKVLPTARATDSESLERFYREARAVAAVDHPNIVHAYDIDQDENLHFIVMEHVDGPSLQDIVRRSGPLSLERACHYISQAAQGLSHANKACLVHRDIKPGNILVDSSGVVKILDMGLARFFNDEEDMLTRKHDENVLGTADYLAPEQADDSHDVDIRADIYSLGGTFYFMLTGKTPFGDGSIPQKLMWHRTRLPKPVSFFRNDVPSEVQAVIDRMMAKEPGQRYLDPAEISEALAKWTATPIEPPPDSEMPRFSPAVTNGSMAGAPAMPGAGSPGSNPGKKNWQVKGSAAVVKIPSSGALKRPAVPANLPAANGVGRVTKASPPALAKADDPRLEPTQGQSPDRETEEDAAQWAAVAPDTTEASARGDTPPLTTGKLRPAAKPLIQRLLSGNRWLLAMLTAVTFFVVAVIGIAVFRGLLVLLGR